MNPNFQHDRREIPVRMNQAENRRFRRQSLLRAAIATVARYDIQGATVERICAEAGASRGLIAHYFESKEELLLAALEDWFQTAIKIKREIAEDKSLSAEQRIRQIAASNFTAPSYSWENAAAWQAFTNASRYNLAYADSIRSASRKVRRLLKPLFERAARKHKLKIKAGFAARSLYVLIDGLWNSLATGKDDLKVSSARKVCDKFVDGWFVTNQ